MFSLKTFLVFAVSVSTICQANVKVYRQPGDLIIGGLVPIHFFNDTIRKCGETRDLGALRRVEGIAYAVSKINNDRGILDGITLGYEIYDTCSSTSETLKNALNFIPSLRERDNVIGVVGPQRSSSSLQATTLLGIYNISLISFLSTSDELSNSNRYPYFLRTVPPDKFQVSVITDMLIEYDWKYVAFLYSDDTYGKTAEAEFSMQADANDICIGYTRSIVAGATDYGDVMKDLLSLKKKSLVSVVIIFTQFEQAAGIFEAAGEADVAGDFIWIGSDGWGNYGLQPVGDNHESVLGAFTIVPQAGTHPLFNQYFEEIQRNSTNPWLPEYYARCNCEFVDERPEPPYESIVIDSVEVFARGLDNMITHECGQDVNKTQCLNFLLKNRRLLRDYLLEVTFTSESNGQVSFTTDGDSKGRYVIRNLGLMGDGTEFRFENVGTWSESEDESIQPLDIGHIDWYVTNTTDPSTYTDRAIPKSVCSDPCKPLEVMRVDLLSSCCWSCEVCADDEIIVDDRCVSCFHRENQTYNWPNEELTQCQPLDFVQLIDKVENALLLVIAILGIIVELVIAFLYVKNREKRLIKASSRELGYIILVGIFLTYLSAVLYCSPPNHVVCVLRRILPSIGSSFIYVSLLTMTVRLYRIFSAGKKTRKRPSFISPKSQVILTMTISLAPLIWGIVWIIIDPPAVNVIEPTSTRQYIELMCEVSTEHRVGQLCWDVFIVLQCCYFAIKTRNLPANYNQTRFIAFSVFSTLIVYIAFAPAFFTSQESTQQDLYSALGNIIQPSVVLVLIFAVRIYAIYRVKEEDQKIITTRPSMKRSEESDSGGRGSSNQPHSPVRTISTHVLSNGSSKSFNDLCTQTIEAEFDSDRIYKYTNGSSKAILSSSASIELEVEEDGYEVHENERNGENGAKDENHNNSAPLSAYV